jgi:hypothetical protein
MNWQELLERVRGPIGKQVQIASAPSAYVDGGAENESASAVIPEASASFAYGTGCVEYRRTETEGFAPSAYVDGIVENASTSKSTAETSASFADVSRLGESQQIAHEEYLDHVVDDDSDRDGAGCHFSGTEDMYAKGAKAIGTGPDSARDMITTVSTQFGTAHTADDPTQGMTTDQEPELDAIYWEAFSTLNTVGVRHFMLDGRLTLAVWAHHDTEPIRRAAQTVHGPDVCIMHLEDDRVPERYRVRSAKFRDMQCPFDADGGEAFDPAEGHTGVQLGVGNDHALDGGVHIERRDVERDSGGGPVLDRSTA